MEQWCGSALTILPQYLAMILAGRKTWELRKFRSLLAVGQCVPLAASDTCKIWGSAMLTAVEWKTRLKEAQSMHGVSPSALDDYVQGIAGPGRMLCVGPHRPADARQASALQPARAAASIG